MSGARKDLHTLLRRLRALGCEVTRHRGHYRVTAPGGASISVSGTPRSGVALLKATRDVRKFLGIEVEP